MWKVRVNMPFDTRLKMTPFCYDWQSVCWVILRIHALFLKIFVDLSPAYVATFLALMIAIIYSCYSRYKRFTKEVPMKEIKALRERVQGVSKAMVNMYDTLNSTLEFKADKVNEPIAKLLMDAMYEDQAIVDRGYVGQSETIMPVPVDKDVMFENPPKFDSRCYARQSEMEAAMIEKPEIIENHGKRLTKRRSNRSPSRPAKKPKESPTERMERQIAQLKTEILKEQLIEKSEIAIDN